MFDKKYNYQNFMIKGRGWGDKIVIVGNMNDVVMIYMYMYISCELLYFGVRFKFLQVVVGVGYVFSVFERVFIGLFRISFFFLLVLYVG